MKYFAPEERWLTTISLSLTLAASILLLNAFRHQDSADITVKSLASCGSFVPPEAAVAKVFDQMLRPSGGNPPWSTVAEALRLAAREGSEFRIPGQDDRLTRTQLRSVRLQCGALLDATEIVEASAMQLVARGIALDEDSAPGLFAVLRVLADTPAISEVVLGWERFDVQKAIEFAMAQPIVYQDPEAAPRFARVESVLAELRKNSNG